MEHVVNDALETVLCAVCDKPARERGTRRRAQPDRRQARRIITGETAPRKVGVSCVCGHVLRVTLDTAGVRCPGCETSYGHSEALQLPLAERLSAA
jgi:hypothetical protein